MQRAGTGEQARGVQVWLRLMGVLCLVTVAVSALRIVPYYESVSDRLSIDESYFFILSFLASGVVVLLALSSLSLAMAASLRFAADARRHATEVGPSMAAPPASAAVPAGTPTMREWLMAVGLLCLLPPVVLVVHAGLTRSVVDWGYTYVLGAIAMALVTLTCLSFGFARSLHECSRLADRSKVVRQRIAASPPEGDANSQGSVNWEREEVSPENWLVVMGGLCLLAAPVSGYCILMSTWFYSAFPRWDLVAFAFAGGMVFGLLALSSVSFAAVRILRLLKPAGGATSGLPSHHRPWRSTAPLYLTGVLCLLAAMPILLHALNVLNYSLDRYTERLLAAVSWVFALVTLAALSFGVARGRCWLSLLAEGADGLPSPSEEEGPQAGDASVELTPAPVPPERPPARSPWRRRALIAGGLVAAMATTLVGYALALGRQGAGLAPFLGSDGSYEDALTAWTWVARVSPGDAEAHRGRGAALAMLGRYEEALTALDKAIALDPDDDDAHYNRAVVFERLGRYEEALAAFDRAITLYSGAIALNPIRAISQGPDLGRAYGGKAWIYHELGRYEEELAAWDRAIALDPENAWSHNGRAWICHELGRYEEALAAYDEAIALDSDEAEVHYNRARTLTVLDRHEEALAAFDRAIEVDPDDALAHSDRGWALGNLGRYEEALAAFDRGIEMDPDEALAHYNRACAYALLGRKNDALRDLERAIELDGRLQEGARTEDNLSSLHSDPHFKSLTGTGEERPGK